MRRLRGHGTAESSRGAVAVAVAICVLFAACSSNNQTASTDASATAAAISTASTGAGSTIPSADTASPGSTSTVPDPSATSTNSVSTTVEPERTCAPPDSPLDPAAPVVLQLWSDLSTETEKVLAQQILEFNGSGRGIEIQMTHTGSSEDTIKLLGTGQRPDLVTLGIEGLINLDDSGFVTKAETCIANDPTVDTPDLLPIAAATYQLRGEQLAMPLTVSTPVLYYDKALFIRAGLDPDHPPQTMEELRWTLRTLVAMPGITKGLVYGDPRWFVNQWAAQLGIPIGEHDNGHDVPEGSGTEVHLDDPRLAEALDTLVSMDDEGLIGDPTHGFEDLAALITGSGRAAMAFHTSGSASLAYEITEQSPDLGVVGMAPLPGPGTGGLVGGAALWITTGDPSKAWPAWEATRFFTDAAEQVPYAQLGYAPARLSTALDPVLAASWVARPGLRVAFDQLRAVSVTGAHLALAAGTETQISYRLDLLSSDILTQGFDPTSGLAEAQADINVWLSTYNTARYGNP